MCLFASPLRDAGETRAVLTLAAVGICNYQRLRCRYQDITISRSFFRIFPFLRACVLRMVSGKELRAEQGRWKREVLTNDGSVQPWWDLGSYNCKECQCQACVPVEKLDEKNHPGISKELSQGLFYVESKQQQFLLLFFGLKAAYMCE